MSTRSGLPLTACAASSPVHVVCICVIFQLLCGKFEGFLKQLEGGEERLQSCGSLAAQLLSCKHPQSSAVRETLQQLRSVLVVLPLRPLLPLCGGGAVSFMSVLRSDEEDLTQ